MLAKKRYHRVPSKIAKRSRIRKTLGTFLKAITAIAVFAAPIFLLRADFLQVGTVEIVGTKTLPTEIVKNTASNFLSGKRFLFIPKSNILLLDKEKLAAILMSTFPRLEKVEINKRFLTRNLELSVTERETEFLWCSESDACFLMSKDGLIFDSADKILTEPEKSVTESRVIFKGILNGDPLMKSFATKDKMRNYSSFIETFKNAGLNIFSISIESPNKAVAATDTGNVIFNPEEENLSSVAQDVLLLTKEIKIKNPSAQFQYIDARFGNKLFYKPR